MKKLLFALCYAFGVTRFISWCNRKRIPILCYHSVTMRPDGMPDDDYKQHLPGQLFRSHLRHLSDHYHVISLDEYLAYRREGREVPPYSVVLTFDDGVRNFLTVAVPLLKEMSFPATNFIVTNLASSAMKNNHKSSEWTPDDDQSFLSWTEVQELARSPQFTFGSHTCSHPRLTEVSPDEVEQELRNSFLEVTEHLNCESLALSFPHNLTSASISEMAQSLGYACALTARLGPNEADEDLFALRRTVIAADDDLATFAARISGLTWWFDRARGRFNRLVGIASEPHLYGAGYSVIKGLDYD